MASLIGGVVYDAGSGSYAGVMVVFVVVTVIALVAATGVPIGTDVEAAGYQKAAEQRYIYTSACLLVPCLVVSVRVA